ncbi:MAG: OmpA family protein [Deltaproteobacteria bacterium]|nr:OmpA family protein [Deltaproteobacteria bacterium]MBW2530844.1 OmpA family protein [Deltaproteobacteria bacterium]
MDTHLRACTARPSARCLDRPRRGSLLRSATAAACVAASAFALGGCVQEVPPRPVPQPEAQPELPPWYPEQPWSEQSSDRVYLEGKVVFELNRSELRPQSKQVLQKLAEYLEANPDISRVRLEGHTCDLASDEHNQALSVRRATSVADWLVDQGLDHMRLLAVAFGETRPMHSNATDAGRRENRRTSFHIAEIGGTPFRGQDPTNGGLILEVLDKDERARANEVGKVPSAPPEKPVVPTGDTIGPMEEPASDEPKPAAQPAAEEGKDQQAAEKL